MIKFWFLFFSLFINYSHALTYDYEVVDFDQSMGVSNRLQYDLMLRAENSKYLLDFYRELYNKNNFNNVKAEALPKIPKIIHHIWVGPNPIPKLYLKYAEQCKNLHPDWEYKLWRQEDIDKENFDPKYMKYFERFAYRYNGKKDIIEYLILYKYGGVVMDMDFQCIKPLDGLHHRYDFYAGLEPEAKWSKVPVMTNAIVGSKPGNHLFLLTLEEGAKLFDSYYQKQNSGLKYYFRIIKNFFINGDNIRVPDSRFVFMRTLAMEFYKQPNLYGTSIVLPATYFNPIFPPQYRGYNWLDKMKIQFGIISASNYFTKSRPETIAIQDFYD